MRIECPMCGEVADVAEDHRGKKGRCKCGTVYLLVPRSCGLESNVFVPSESKPRNSRGWSIASGVAIVAATAIALMVAAYAFIIVGNSRSMATLIATSEKFDGKSADKVKFWIELQRSGNASWVQMDQVFAGKVPVSEETRAAYRRWRQYESKRSVTPRPQESSKIAGDRLRKAVSLWDDKHEVRSWINDVENRGSNGRPFEAVITNPYVDCCNETIIAYFIWIAAIDRERGNGNNVQNLALPQ